MRGQAALFDGILFLLLVMFSVSMVYAYLTVYGTAQERTLRSSHELNYMQALVKALYSVDVSTLQAVPKWEAFPNEVLNPAYADLDCSKLAPYQGRLSAADLLKKDLSDFSDTSGANPTCGGPSTLDDKFGTADAPGTTALRCALKEFMKPFTFAGLEYLAEVQDQCGNRVPVAPTTVVLGNRPLTILPKIQTCDDAAQAFQEVLAVRAPFRIRADIPSGALGGVEPKTFTYTIRLCVWRKPRA